MPTIVALSCLLGRVVQKSRFTQKNQVRAIWIRTHDPLVLSPVAYGDSVDRLINLDALVFKVKEIKSQEAPPT